MNIVQQLRDQKKHEVTKENYDYFLEVLPPVTGPMLYQGEQWDFGFAEGAETVRLFKHESGKYYAIETPYLNPYECGSIDSQTKRWIMEWIKIGKKNPWIREADDPPFNTQSFHECKTDAELLEKLANGNWCNGQAFHIGNLCFIEQGNSNDEWLTIKDGVAFESISFAHIIKEEGKEFAQKIIDDIRAATVEQCRKLEYGGPG